MEGAPRLIGYVIIDPGGRHPAFPDYGVAHKQHAIDEAEALNTDFAEDICWTSYGVLELYEDGATSRIV